MGNQMPDQFAFDADRLRRIREIEEKTQPGYRPHRSAYAYLRLLLVLGLLAGALGLAYSRRENIIAWVHRPHSPPPADTVPADNY
jgi:hypothetical protein